MESRRGVEKTHLVVLILSSLLIFVTAALAPVSAAPGEKRNFTARLTSEEEVAEVESLAQGQAIFRLNEDGTELGYKLISSNIDNITQAHIDLAPEGQHGGTVVWLYPSGPPAQLTPGRWDGVLAEGVITTDSLVGSLATAALTDLLNEMRAGNAYVNVHTSDFPSGEVRGQIQ